MCVPRKKNKFVQVILKQFHIQNLTLVQHLPVLSYWFLYFFHTVSTSVSFTVLQMLLIKECYSTLSRIFLQAANTHSASIDAFAI